MNRTGRLRIGRRAVLAAAVAALVPGCSGAPARPRSRNEPAASSVPAVSSVDVIAAGWHTEINLSAVDVSGPLAVLLPAFPGGGELVFGWGLREYYMAAPPGSGNLMSALLPGPAVMLVIPVRSSLEETFAGAEIFPLGVSAAGLDRLCAFLWAALEKGPDGRPRPLGPGPYPGSLFYASGETYSLGRTCNTFTAEALEAAGLPVRAEGVVTAHQLTDQLRAGA